MENIQIDSEILGRQINEIEELASEANTLFADGEQGALSAAYSEVSGLDQMGASHGAVMQGGVGSAVQTLQKYAEQVAWLRDGLRATERSLTGQEGLASRALQIADEGGAVGEEMTLFPARPDQTFADFDFPSPSVAIPSSLSELSAAFASTDGAAVAASAESWSSMAKNATMLAENIRMTAWDIAEVNKSDSINAAVDKALEVADAADVFATNAGLMSTSVTYMGQVADAGALHVAMAELAIAFIEDPAEREAAEQAFLQSFMGSEFPSAVESAMPVIRNLMKLEQGGTGGGELQASMGLVDGNGRPGPLARLNAGSQQLESLLADPAQIGPGSFAEVSKNMAELDNVKPGGGVGSIGGLATEAAGANLGALNAVTPVAGMPGAGAHASASPAIGSFGAPAVGGMAPFGRGVDSAGRGVAPVGRGAASIDGARGFNPDLSVAKTQAAGVGAGAAPAGLGGIGAGMGGIAGGVPFGAGGGRAGQGSGKGMGSVLAPGFSSGVAMTGPNGAVPVATTGSAMARGMMPMAGMPMAAQQQENKRGKVKTVTSAVEEEGNIAALLGDLPPVVPGPIGAWARG